MLEVATDLAFLLSIFSASHISLGDEWHCLENKWVDTYNLAAYMDIELTKVNNWSQNKRLWLIRKSGKATISCDLKSSQPINTVVDGPGDLQLHGRMRAKNVCALRLRLCMIWRKRRRRIDSDDVTLVAKKARKVRLDGTALNRLTSPQTMYDLLAA